MRTNYDCILHLIDVIEADLSITYSIDMLANEVGYSKYHMHKIFSYVVGMSVYQYIKKRRLSEAAKKLICTDERIIDIALDAGYESQRAFSKAFKVDFSLSPKAFRQKAEKFSLTPRFVTNKKTNGESVMDVRLEKFGSIILAGYAASTMKGFFIIPRLWKKLHKAKDKLDCRLSKEWTYALNDYENAEKNESGFGFDYYACVDIEGEESSLKNMSVKKLPQSRYAIFSFRAKPQDPIDKAIDYIYKSWFPASTYQLNHEAKYDFVKYGEATDKNGIADIEVWVPIL